jgi:hypothetical protein
MNMRLTALVATAIVFSTLSGYGVYSLNAMGLMTPPTPLSVQAVECQAKGRQNAKYPDVYELLRTQGGCDMLAPYSKAYPTAPVPLKPETAEATPTQGKP